MQDPMMALRRVDFDWTAHVDQIWRDCATDVPEIQATARLELQDRIDSLLQSRSEYSPLGLPLLGAAGAGKTHLLGALRRQALAASVFFVLVDMTDVHNFWDTVLLGYLRSLQQPGRHGKRQVDHWLAQILKRFGATVRRAESIPQQRPPGLIVTCNEVIHAVRREYPEKTQEHGDILRALILFACDHAEINDLGYKWLQGIGIDADEREHHGFREAQRAPQRIVKGLSWLLSLEAPTVMALDQLDAIVAEHNLASTLAGDEPSSQQQMSLSIIQGISGGLIALRDVTLRTINVVSTLQATWEILSQRSAVSMADRFEPALHLGTAIAPDAMKGLVVSRLTEAYTSCGFAPPYPAYPFTDAFFEMYRENTPRELLKACDSHRQSCKRRGGVVEADGSPPTSKTTVPPWRWKETILRRLEELEAQTDIIGLLSDQTERSLDLLLETACRALLVENALPTDVIPKVESEFLGTGAYDPLHARVRLILTGQGERERHHSFRFLQQGNHRAFQVRLKAAITASGIDHAIGFRKLTVLRRGNVPTGAATQELVKQFRERGGHFVEPTDAELRLLWALSHLFENEPPHLEEWLREACPVSQSPGLGSATRWLFEGLTAAPMVTPPEPRVRNSRFDMPPIDVSPVELSDTAPVTAPSPTKPASSRDNHQLALGRQLVAGSLDHTVTLSLASLAQHTCVFAGSGSGKTVFLRRILEEAALSGVPSIV
ncbi:MAG TPA: AAA family ATPase, partial [Polyangiaceae bacterium]